MTVMIPLLAHKNYHMWTSMIQAYLRRANLQKYTQEKFSEEKKRRRKSSSAESAREQNIKRRTAGRILSVRQNSELRTHDKIQESGFRIQNFRTSEYRTQNFRTSEHKIQNLEFRTQNSRFKSQNLWLETGHRTQNSRFKSQNLWFGTQDLEFKIQVSEFMTWKQNRIQNRIQNRT